MDKNELLEIFENGMTVGELIKKLEQFDTDMLVINTRDKAYLPVADVNETSIDYCYDEIITKKVVSIW
jgi:hypothetical protein